MTTARTQWQWELVDTDGAALDRPLSPTFTTRFDAEAWLGETWRLLSAQGVAAVVLRHDGRPAAAVLPLPVDAPELGARVEPEEQSSRGGAAGGPPPG